MSLKNINYSFFGAFSLQNYVHYLQVNKRALTALKRFLNFHRYGQVEHCSLNLCRNKLPNICSVIAKISWLLIDDRKSPGKILRLLLVLFKSGLFLQYHSENSATYISSGAPQGCERRPTYLIRPQTLLRIREVNSIAYY